MNRSALPKKGVWRYPGSPEWITVAARQRNDDGMVVCAICPVVWPPILEWEMDWDHIEPQLLGGVTTIDNLQLTCPSCNRAKSTRSMDDARAFIVPYRFDSPFDRFHARQRDRWANDDDWRERKKSRIRDRQRRPDVRAARRERERKVRESPEWRENKNRAVRERRANDAEWRESERLRIQRLRQLHGRARNPGRRGGNLQLPSDPFDTSALHDGE